VRLAGYAQCSPDVETRRPLPVALVAVWVLMSTLVATAARPEQRAGPPSNERAGRSCNVVAKEIFGREPPTLGSETPEPKKIRHVKIQFPSRDLPPQGANIFVWAGEALIDPEGDVHEVFVTRDLSFDPPWPEMSSAIEEAIGRWKYEPTLVQGEPVAVCMSVSVSLHW
jgi:hypothetical protein